MVRVTGHSEKNLTAAVFPRFGVASIARMVALSIAVSVTSCGMDKTLGPKNKDSNDSSAPAAVVAPVSGPKVYELVADYKRKPVTVLIIRDLATRSAPYSSRLASSIPILTSKLWNLASITGSVQVAMFDHAYVDLNATDNVTAPINASPIVTTIEPKISLNAEEMDNNLFHTKFVERFAVTTDRPATSTGAVRSDPQTGTVLANILEEAKKENGGLLGGLLAPDRFVAVLYLSVLPTADAFEMADIMALAADRVGNFSVSALVADKGGCTVAGTSNPVVETNRNKLPMRNLEIKLQEATGGIFGSICDLAYVNTFEAFVNKGTGSEYFPVKLGGKVDSITSIIGEGGTPITEYRFKKGSDTVEISTKIASGQRFTVTAVVEALPGETIVGSPVTDKVPLPGASTLSPAEASFIATVQPALNRNCASCHGGRPYNTGGGYINALTFKTDIGRRIGLTVGSAGRMPPTGEIPDADKALIVNWVNSR